MGFPMCLSDLNSIFLRSLDLTRLGPNQLIILIGFQLIT